MIPEWHEILLLILGGLLSGFLNTVASSGSAISLPLLVYVGLPAIEANATNRIPLLLGLITATISFQKKKLIPWPLAKKLALPIIIGTIVGCLFITKMSDFQIHILLTFALIMSVILILTGANSFLKNHTLLQIRSLDLVAYVIALGLGIWGGLIVIDIGTLTLFFLVLYLRYDLVTSNAIKVVLILMVALISTVYYGLDGDVNWGIGLILAIGSITGSYLGARFTTKNNSVKFVYGILVFMISSEVIIAIIKLLKYKNLI